MPILYKLLYFKDIEYIWNSTVVVILLLFLVFLFDGLSIILKITSDDLGEKKKENFFEKNESNYRLHKKIVVDKEIQLPESSVIELIVMRINNDFQIIGNDEFEKNYYLNNILKAVLDCDLSLSRRIQSSLTIRLLNMINSNKIKIIYVSDERISFKYPLLDGLTTALENFEENQIYECHEKILELLQAQEYLEAPLLIKFYLENVEQFHGSGTQIFDEIFDKIIQLETYSTDELVFQLFIKYQTYVKDYSRASDNEQGAIIDIWEKIFQNHSQLKFSFPETDEVNFSTFVGTTIPINISINLYVAAVIVFLYNHPETDLKEQMLKSIGEVGKNVYESLLYKKIENCDKFSTLEDELYSVVLPRLKKTT
ncbi:TPA: hypothetical protein TXS27_001400 [Streptococcus suis]|nr:hypothetical protein [Streptococcus suis]